MAKIKNDKLDRDIELAWYRLARGVQIDIWDIPKVFKKVREDVEAGKDLDRSVNECITVFRRN